MNKYIGYIRVSNAEHDTSIPAQKERLETYAKQKGLNLIKIYEERKSAFKANNRKVFNSMIEHLNDEEISGVIFHKLDRSSRNPMEFATLESFFDTKDILVIEGEFDTSSATGRLAFRMFCSLAIFYSENLSEEVSLKMLERLKLGYFPSSCPLGYRKGREGDRDLKKKYPNEKAKVVRKMFEMYASGAHTYRDIASHVRKMGINMDKSRVERILSNTFYIGTLKWQSSKTGEIHVYQGNHEPIITKPLWNEVRKVTKSRAKSKGKITRSPYSQIVMCKCGRLMTAGVSSNGKSTKKYFYLSCRNPNCSFGNLRVEEIDFVISEFIQSLQPKLEAVQRLVELHNDETGATPIVKEIEIIEQEINHKTKRLDVVQEAYLDSILSKEDALRKTALLKQEIQELKSEKKDLNNKKIKQKLFDFDELANICKTLGKAYPRAKNSIKAKILRLLLSNTFIKDGFPVPALNSDVLGVAICSILKTGRPNETLYKQNQEAISQICYDEIFANRIKEIETEISAEFGLE
jgi:DNA invertase Pin-like site-specific DNA recombinase